MRVLSLSAQLAVSALVFALSACRPDPQPAAITIDDDPPRAEVPTPVARPSSAGHQAHWTNRTNRTSLTAYRTVAAAIPERAPTALTWFWERGEARLAFLRTASAERKEELFYLTTSGDEWSSPLAVPEGTFRPRGLLGVTALSSGTPMAVVLGDNTDYAAVYGPAEPAHADPALIDLQNRNRRLFYRFVSTPRWTEPLPIAGSLGALFGSLAAGPDRRAYLVFARDLDNSDATSSDRDLYFVYYDGRAWHPTTRLTEDPGREYALETRYLGDQVLAVWTRDADGDLDTTGDRTLHYAAFGADGAPLSPPGLVTPATYDRPRAILGAVGGQPTLLFEGNPERPDGPRPLLEARWAAGWSEPADTGLSVGRVTRGSLFDHQGQALLVFEDGNNLVGATRDASGWHSSGLVQGFDASGAVVSEAVYSLTAEAELDVVVATSAPRGATGAPALDIRRARLPLHADLSVEPIVPTDASLIVGATVRLPVVVRNRGYLASGAFRLLVRDGEHVIGELSAADGLTPGQEQRFELPVEISRPHLDLVAEVRAPARELETDNNRQRVTLVARPDFEIAKLERQGATLRASVRDRKGVATSPVNVDFSLVAAGVATVIGSATYDPNFDVPVELEYPPLQTLTGPFSIIAKVNSTTKVVEDSYTNNLATFVYAPQVDFVISELSVSSEAIRVTLVNQGDAPAPSVALLLTTSPELAASPAPIDGTAPLYFAEVPLQDGRGSLELPPSSSISSEPFLYGVVNPYGEVSERNRNNNTARTSTHPPRTRRATLYAMTTLDLGPNSQVVGDVAVRNATSEHPPRSLTLAPGAMIDGSARADRIDLAPGSLISQDATYNQIDRRPNATIGGRASSPLPLPVVVAVPATPPIAPGQQAITVPRGSTLTLAEGAYAGVCVGCSNGGGRGTTRLLLAGGTYHFASLTLGAGAELQCSSPCEVRVAGDFTTGPQTTAGSAATALTLFVAGARAEIGPHGGLAGTLTAPSARLRVAADAALTGSVIAKEIDLGPRVQVQGERMARATIAPLGAAISSQRSDRPSPQTARRGSP